MNLEFYFIADLKKGLHVPMHHHPALEIVYFLSGRGRTAIQKTSYEFHCHNFTVLAAGTLHDQINRTAAASFCLGLSASGLESFQGHWRDADGMIHAAIQRFQAEMSRKKPYYQETARGILIEIAGLVKRAAGNCQPPSLHSPVVAQALSLIQQRKGIVSVADLADHLYISKDYLRHLFQEQTSQSPIRHIINARIEKARDLLADPELPIIEVAHQCGFENFYYFSRLFKKETRLSPSAYRKSITEKGK